MVPTAKCTKFFEIWSKWTRKLNVHHGDPQRRDMAKQPNIDLERRQ